MTQVPLLFLGDAPSRHTGLARIGRHLASLLAACPAFRVGYLGWGGVGAHSLAFAQYTMRDNEWGWASLPEAWDDFSRGERGVVFTVWDLTRLLWLARPEFVPDEGTQAWLLDARANKFKVWSYLPIDSAGPSNRLTALSRDTLLGLDRLLTYSPWALDVVSNTIGIEEAARRDLSWLPHGLSGVWQPKGE